MAGKPRRTRLLVNPVQHKLLSRHLLHLLAVGVPLLAAIVLPMTWMADDPTLSPAEQAWAASHLRVLARALLPALPAVLLLCLFHALLVSHRIGGPLVRFRRTLEQVGRGKLDLRVKLRRNDYLTLEAEAINQMITALALRVERIRQLQREANATMPALARAIARDEASEAAVLAGKLGTQLDELDSRLRQFSLPDDAPPSRGSGAAEHRAEIGAMTR